MFLVQLFRVAWVSWWLVSLRELHGSHWKWSSPTQCGGCYDMRKGMSMEPHGRLHPHLDFILNCLSRVPSVDSEQEGYVLTFLFCFWFLNHCLFWPRFSSWPGGPRDSLILFSDSPAQGLQARSAFLDFKKKPTKAKTHGCWCFKPSPHACVAST